jgi:signal transduction histidine kinase
MPKISLTIGLVLYGFGLVVLTLLDVFFSSPSVNPAGFGYRLTDSFGETSLNNRVLFASAFRLVPGESLASVQKRIRQSFRPNRYVHAVVHGHVSNAPEGWIYLPLTNPTATPKEVVLSMPTFRCSRATLFQEGAGPPLAGPGRVRLDSVATLLRDTPLGNRFFISYRFAFPITLAPGQTSGVLLRTSMDMGYHEIDLKLSSRSIFQEDGFYSIIQEGMIMVCCLLIGLVSLGIGFATPSRLMLTFGLWMLLIMVGLAYIYGYLSPIRYPQWASFNSTTIGISVRLLLDIAVQLFLYESIKPVAQTFRWYIPAMWTFNAVAIGGILLHFLPPHLYPYVNLPINRVMTSMSIINLSWIGYFSLVAYRRAGIVSIGLALLLFVGEIVVKQLTELLLGNELSILKFPVPNPLLLIGMLTYLAASQFRRELVTKQRMQKQVSTTRRQMDTLRREEIERIGRDLHDQVGNTLASALGYITSPQANADKPHELIRDAITELRFLSHNLVKDDDRPLTDKVETLVSRFNDFSLVRFVFQDYTESAANDLPRIQQQSIYGILQELLTNAVRHSGASVAYVQFFCDKQTIEIAVEDDGVGFDLTTAQNSGIGLQNMFKRAELARITLRFDPAPTGTSVYLSIPRHEHTPNRPD